MTFAKSTLSLCCALLFSGSLSAALLGDMTVRSVPGEPFDAILTIEDVDLSTTPSMVRVAPPGTYLREGVTWPEQVQDLRLQRDSSASNRVTVRVVGRESLAAESFPLLIELNVGGNVSVRQYDLRVENGHFAVVADAPRRTVTALTPTVAKAAVQTLTVDAASDPKEVRKLQKRLARKGRYAPYVVRDYVALNGFDSTEPFPVIEDMTIWSIAKLYWPVFEGCTMEQLVVGFEEKNPEAFLKNDPSKLVIGSKLTAPSRAEVLAIDPVAAFRRVHGDDMVIPMPTQNLIDAQALDLETAEFTARAQTEARERGASPADVAAAGRAALEAQRAQKTMERELRGEEHPGVAPVPAVSNDEAKPVPTSEMAPSAETVPSQKTIEPSALVNDAEETERVAESMSTSPEVPDEKVIETPEDSSSSGLTAEDLPTADDAADESVTSETVDQPADPTLSAPEEALPSSAPTRVEKSVEPVAETNKVEPLPVKDTTEPKARDTNTAFPAGAVAVGVFLLLLLLWLLRRKKAEPEEEKKASQSVTLQKNIPVTSDAQLKALERTVDEAVKNGTTAGAMGVGAAAYAEERAKEEATDSSTETNEMPSVEETIPAADGTSQPWLEPDDEMPPIDEDDRQRTSDRAVSDVVGDLSLDLEPAEEVTPAKEAVVSASQTAAVQVPTGPRSEREVAQTAALDGKLKLAQAFVGLGALKEARELLHEVKTKGTIAQREAARYLEERIGEGN